ncbi:hypothetical protein DPMN_142973 [Dreissena polymorpha]|uniref:Uncharacterized protein n=1 Tax=Dreissena polymorpha TaxID=45954 RepID=A0A9D4GI93_DREPO|nr:hypothetical protein DPMN_142973 [Dreissena polymorpha]
MGFNVRPERKKGIPVRRKRSQTCEQNLRICLSKVCRYWRDHDEEDLDLDADIADDSEDDREP